MPSKKYVYAGIALLLWLLIALPVSAKKIWSKSQPRAVAAAEEAVPEPEPAPPSAPELLHIFAEAYPDIGFASRWEEELSDWKIRISVPGTAEDGLREYEVLWAGGSLLPPEELGRREKYWTLLYRYAAELPDPAGFTEEDIERMRNFGSASNRRDGAGTPMFFFDMLYDGFTRAGLEANIVPLNFLGCRTRVHRRMTEPLQRVEAAVRAAAQSDPQVQAFLSGIKSTDAYYWRQISGTNRKSFHSYGIAIDILPKSLGGKEIFWSWAKDRNPDGWMLTPLERRWMPPPAVIAAFEDEGFIWGGKWAVWDNMHFEYHPELIRFGRQS